MKLDCDASEYAPLGTLQGLFVALARKGPKLSALFIDNALLKYENTAALSRTKLVKNLWCGFEDPQSIEPISKMI